VRSIPPAGLGGPGQNASQSRPVHRECSCC